MAWAAQTEELVGRDVEQEELRSALQAAADGRGGLLLVGGEAGVGKTRLVEHVVRRDDLAFLGAAATQEGTPPYGQIVSVFRAYLRLVPDGLADCGPLGTYLALLLPELGALPGSADRASIFESCCAARGQRPSSSRNGSDRGACPRRRASLRRQWDSSGAGSESRRRGRYISRWIARLLPGPPPVEFDLEREAKERPDEHDHRQDAEAAKCRRHRDSPNDVCGDDKFQAEEDCSSQCLSTPAVRRESSRAAGHVTGGRISDAHDDHKNTGAVDRLPDVLDDLAKAHCSLPLGRRLGLREFASGITLALRVTPSLRAAYQGSFSGFGESGGQCCDLAQQPEKTGPLGPQGRSSGGFRPGLD